MFIKTLLISIVMLTATFSAVKAQASASDSTIAGKWAGTFDGASTGKFELVLNQDSNRKLAGQVIMITDDGSRYPIDLKTVTWDKGKLSATYTDPSDGDEVSFVGSYTAPTMKGTWKSNEGQAVGTWQVTRAK